MTLIISFFNEYTIIPKKEVKLKLCILYLFLHVHMYRSNKICLRILKNILKLKLFNLIQIKYQIP